MLSGDLKFGALLLSFTVSQRKIDRIFAKRPPRFERTLRAPGLAYRKCAAVKLEAAPCENLEDYISRLETEVAAAAEKGVHIVCFPQYTGLLSLSLLPAFERILGELRGLEREEENLRDAFWLVLETLSGFLLETYLSTFQSLAKEYQVTIMAGSIYVLEGEKIHSRAYLFDPTGRVVGHQDKLLLDATEELWGVTPGEEIGIFDTLMGKVAILFEEDLTQFETVKVAKELGAQVILCPGGSFQPLEEYRTLLPVLRAQEEGIYIVRAGLEGELGVSFTGEAGVYAPYELTPNRDGRLTPSEESSLVIGVVDPNKLADGWECAALDSNPQFYQKVLFPLYQTKAEETQSVETV